MKTHKKRFNYQQVTNGKNIWHFTGTFDSESKMMELRQIYGDVTDMDGLREGIKALLVKLRLL